MAYDCVIAAWRNHEPEIHGYLVRNLGDVHLAEDLLQDTFLKAMRQGESFCSIENPRAWLFQVARNALIDQARRSRPQEELSDALAAPIADERDPIDALDACLERNLGEMSPEDREIIEQCDLKGVKQQSFANQHGLGLPAVKSRLQRARKRLRDSLMLNCQVNFDESGKVCCHTPR